MKETIADFFEWLFAYRTHPVWAAMFILGCIVVCLVAFILVAEVLGPGAVILSLLAIFISLPIIVFWMRGRE